MATKSEGGKRQTIANFGIISPTSWERFKYDYDPRTGRRAAGAPASPPEVRRRDFVSLVLPGIGAVIAAGIYLSIKRSSPAAAFGRQNPTDDEPQPDNFSPMVWTGPPLNSRPDGSPGSRAFGPETWVQVRRWRREIEDQINLTGVTTDGQTKTLKKLLQEAGYGPEVIEALIWVESNGNPNAYNQLSGATGLGQIMTSDGSGHYQCRQPDGSSRPCFAGRPTIQEMKDPEKNIGFICQLLAGYIAKYTYNKADYHSLVYGLNRYYGSQETGYGDLILWLAGKIRSLPR